MRRLKKRILIAFVAATAMVVLAIAHFRTLLGKNGTSSGFDESSMVTDYSAIPEEICFAAMNELVTWRSFCRRRPDHFKRSNGYTCAVWKWPIATWDPELKSMSDEFRVWVKDDTAEVVTTPPFFLSHNTKAKPPRLTADKAMSIAQMKTALYWTTNVVTDVGAYFKVDFFSSRLPVNETNAPCSSVWVSKSDWSVCGNPFSPVPMLTEQEALSAALSIRRLYSPDESIPVRIDRIADLTILTVSRSFSCHGRDGVTNFVCYVASIWIDNATRNVISVVDEPN